MKLPFRRKKTVAERILHALAKVTGMVVGLIKRRALRPGLPHARSGKA
jgi:hypothetical protein